VGEDLHTGHFTAARVASTELEPMSSNWYMFNDDEVTLTNYEAVEKMKDIYLLLYKHIT